MALVELWRTCDKVIPFIRCMIIRSIYLFFSSLIPWLMLNLSKSKNMKPDVRNCLRLPLCLLKKMFKVTTLPTKRSVKFTTTRMRIGLPIKKRMMLGLLMFCYKKDWTVQVAYCGWIVYQTWQFYNHGSLGGKVFKRG